MLPSSLMETLSPGNIHSLSLPRAAGLKGPSGPGGSGVWGLVPGPGRVELGGVSGRPGGWRRRVLASPPPWSPGCQHHGWCQEPKKINKPVFISSPITSTLKTNRYWPCHLERSEQGPGVSSSWRFQCPVNTVTRCPRPGLSPLLYVLWDTCCRLPLPPCLPQTPGHGTARDGPREQGQPPARVHSDSHAKGTPLHPQVGERGHERPCNPPLSAPKAPPGSRKCPREGSHTDASGAHLPAVLGPQQGSHWGTSHWCGKLAMGPASRAQALAVLPDGWAGWLCSRGRWCCRSHHSPRGCR